MNLELINRKNAARYLIDLTHMKLLSECLARWKKWRPSDHLDELRRLYLIGDLHAVLIINDVEMYGTYWTSWRMCIPCALSEHIVEYRETVLKKGEKK
jgi:hypothetical protein